MCWVISFEPRTRLGSLDVLLLRCPTVRVSPRQLSGFEMETISSIAEVVCCELGICLPLLPASAASLRVSRGDVSFNFN